MERSAPPLTNVFGSGFSETVVHKEESSSSGVSWGAVIGGAFVAAALALILLSLGAGLGLSSVSPWSNTGASATAIGVAAIVWLIVAQILASSSGTARKGAAHPSLWIFVALLAGAFFASFSATIGGRHRDHVQTI